MFKQCEIGEQQLPAFIVRVKNQSRNLVEEYRYPAPCFLDAVLVVLSKHRDCLFVDKEELAFPWFEAYSESVVEQDFG